MKNPMSLKGWSVFLVKGHIKKSDELIEGGLVRYYLRPWTLDHEGLIRMKN